MIKLKKSPKPDYLAKREAKLTEDFKSDLAEKIIAKERGEKKDVRSVWNKEPIKEALLNDSYNKCAYCESKVSVKSSYMEIDHFFPKGLYPEKVVDWDNLLPSCKRCNGLKGEYGNRNGQDILNPFKDDPREHLLFRYNRFHSANDSSFGEKTIDILNLNDDDLRADRSDMIQLITNLLSDLITLKNPIKLRNKMKAILRAVQPKEEYSAILSTAVHLAPDYIKVKAELISNELWDDELERLHKDSYNLVLDK